MAARLSRRAARAERALSPALDPARHRKVPQRRGRTRRDRACHAQARCRCRGRGALEAFHDDHASRRTRDARTRSEVATPPDRQFEEPNQSKKSKGKRHNEHHATPYPGNDHGSHRAWRTGHGAGRRHRPHRASDQNLLADHDRGNRGAAETVREGRHRGGAHDLSRRRRDVRGDGGGRGRRHPRRHLAGVGRTQEGRDVQGASPMPPWAITAGS